MPEPRRDRTSEVTIRVTLEPGSRDPSATRRRYRRGWRSGYNGGTRLVRPGEGGSVPFEIRNGLPFKPYVYRGTGFDQLTGDRDDA